jgi:hypothetical protein
MTTPVIFRKWPASEGHAIIALFPTEPGTNDPYTCSSYEHVGQHGSADPNGVIQRTTVAAPSEYADLKKELENIGYTDLRIYQKYQYSFLKEREQKIAASRSQVKVSKPVKKTAAKRSVKRSPSGFGGIR